MKKKNVVGYVGLILGLASIAMLIAAFAVPLTKLTGMGFDGKISFYGGTNVALAWIGVVLAIAAIVCGVVSKKYKDRQGPRKPGVIIGIIGVILGLISAGVIGLFSMLTEYINSDGQTGFFADMAKDSPDTKKQVDEAIRKIQEGFGIESKGLPSESADSDTSKTESEAAASEASNSSES